MTAVCPRCGTPRLGEHRFCQNCGFDFNTLPAAPPSSAPPVVPPVAPSPFGQPAQPAQPTAPKYGSRPRCSRHTVSRGQLSRASRSGRPGNSHTARRSTGSRPTVSRHPRSRMGNSHTANRSLNSLHSRLLQPS